MIGYWIVIEKNDVGWLKTLSEIEKLMQFLCAIKKIKSILICNWEIWLVQKNVSTMKLILGLTSSAIVRATALRNYTFKG